MCCVLLFATQKQNPKKQNLCPVRRSGVPSLRVDDDDGDASWKLSPMPPGLAWLPTFCTLWPNCQLEMMWIFQLTQYGGGPLFRPIWLCSSDIIVINCQVASYWPNRVTWALHSWLPGFMASVAQQRLPFVFALIKATRPGVGGSGHETLALFANSMLPQSGICIASSPSSTASSTILLRHATPKHTPPSPDQLPQVEPPKLTIRS